MRSGTDEDGEFMALFERLLLGLLSNTEFADLDVGCVFALSDEY